MDSGHSTPPDHRGARRLSTREEIVWYLLAGVTYVAAGLGHKALLTWLAGPAWVVGVLWFGPAVTDRLARRRQ